MLSSLIKNEFAHCALTRPNVMGVLFKQST